MKRIGFIGTGNFARQHAEILMQLDTQIVACYGTNPEKTAAFSNDFQCRTYDDPLSLISAKIIDALYIVVPPFAYDGKVELKAIEERIPFLCEKPLGLDLSMCEKISGKIAEINLITSSGYLLRYEPLFTQIKTIIDRNLISTVRICSYSYMPKVYWWRQSALSGGMMVETGSHYIDLLRYLFGEIDAVSAIASEGIGPKNFTNCDIYDSMEGILKFKSGQIGSIGVTHILNEIKARHDLLEIYGKDFAMKIDLCKLRYNNEATAVYKELDDNWKTISNPSSKKDLLLSQSSAFLSAIENNNPLCIQSRYPDAVQSLKAALAMNQSAKLMKFNKL